MPKRSSGAILAMLAPQRESSVPLQRQLYDAIRRAILEGGLPPGTRLPSSRGLAAEWGLGRNTVVNAFEQLAAEGYLESRIGSGTYVSDSLPEEFLQVQKDEPGPSKVESKGQLPVLSRRVEWYASLQMTPDPESPIPFSPGLPALDAFPVEQWRRIAARQMRRITRSALSYGDPRGLDALRRSLSSYLNTARGVRCDWRQILILSSSQQALDLCARVLLEPGEKVWMEEPGYLGARGALGAAGARLVPIPVDDEGINVEEGIGRAPEARMVYVTPSHHFPLGSMLSLGRRLALLEWASRSGAWILEDDYDSEFRYAGQPLASLQGLDESGRVFYVGTFSKVLFPSLRLGYLVVPEALLDAFTSARALMDGHPPGFTQRILADFIGEGHFSAHIRRMRGLYRRRMKVLVEALREAFPEGPTVAPVDSGMHLVLDLEKEADDRALSRTLGDSRIDAPSLSRYYLADPQRKGLMLGFCGVPSHELKRGTSVLKRVLEEQAFQD
ncbi:MAG TPA: PLP-dependent aminotransferase family protein [Acidobacteriota bacterium]|nr:PLP-dependent aminotransferase family protein [Acidobacteriota bacterium]